MSYRVLFSEDAERDLADLCHYIVGRDGMQAGDRILREIEQACLRLGDLPERGNIPKELISVGITEYRELHHKPWRMIYRVIGNDVVIYCITDGRRDMRSFLERRLLR